MADTKEELLRLRKEFDSTEDKSLELRRLNQERDELLKVVN